MSKEQYRLAILDEEQSERDDFFNYFELDFDCIALDPMTDIDELISTIRTEKIDAIAIDYKLMDHDSSFKFNGDYFLKSIQDILLDYPSFILTNNPDQAKQESSQINPFYILNKGRMELANPELRMDVLTIIKNYKEQVQKDVMMLRELENIRVIKGLSSSQENDYVELNHKLDRTIDQRSCISSSFYSNGTNSKLDTVINKAEEILKKISDE